MDESIKNINDITPEEAARLRALAAFGLNVTPKQAVAMEEAVEGVLDFSKEDEPSGR